MRFQFPLSLIALGAAAAAAAALPTTTCVESKLSVADQVDLLALPAFPPPMISIKNNTDSINGTDSTKGSSTRLQERTGLFPNRLYRISGWVFYIAHYTLEYYNGTPWKFPPDSISISYIADQVAEDIRTHQGAGTLLNNVGGGWAYVITLSRDYAFNYIPYPVLWGLITLAIQGSNDWAQYENSFTFKMQDINRQEILTLQIFPAVHSTISTIHDEF
ncbi:hypothetical protein NQ176_g8715 [Zarea fungicola]|uniref:Uncharacterized protein n=1 Tax=Zarea fungicola TaxID=93591 RepID=A0ACC1MS51_9HYPO|nr:hypothetical protein NQ176_g8715 [Lecanicillium fungicola]